MKFTITFSLIAILTAVRLASPPAILGQDAAPGTNGLTVVMIKIRADLKAGKHTEADLTDDFHQLDTLLAAENGRRTELAANIILEKGMLYSEVFDDPERAKTYILEVQKNYASTTIAGKLGPLLAMLDQQAESQKIRPVTGTPFSDFSVTDVTGGSLSVAQYKGKVVLLDFWSTGNDVCQIELPNILATYAKYHDQGFEIIGISQDDDQARLLKYVKDQNMPWPEYFDGQKQLAVKYGIHSLPANFLIDAGGNVTATNLWGPNLSLAVAKALGK